MNIDNQFVGAGSPSNSGSTEIDAAKIVINMRVPYQHKILVKMPLLETLKLAYIQYFSFFILVSYIIWDVMLGYAFKRNILETSTFSEIHHINKNLTILNPPKKIN